MGIGLHDHKCLECRIFTEGDPCLDQPCPKCQRPMAIMTAPSVGGFSPFWHPTMDHDPVYIDSAKTLDKELDKRKLFIKEAPKKEKRQRLPKTREEALNA